jgi:hypothetical protein
MEDRGDDVVGADLIRGNHVGQRLRGGDQHRFTDMPALRVEQPTEEAGEGQHVVDLVRVVAAAGGHDGGVLAGRVRADLGLGVGQRESSAVTTPPACSTARVISLTARPRDATSRRTVIE